jgi:hypothetical protein
MVKLSSNTLEGNDRYEGFGIDLIKELSEMSGFNYTFIIQEDSNSGYKDEKTKKWSGMIGEVIDGVIIDHVTIIIILKCACVPRYEVNNINNYPNHHGLG